MKPWIESLLSLQSLDMELRGIETKIATFPSEKARITAEAKESEANVTAVRSELQNLQMKIKSVEGKLLPLRKRCRNSEFNPGPSKRPTNIRR